MTQQPPANAHGPIKAILKVMADIGRMEAEGKNDFHGYAYIKASDVHNVLRPVMAEHGLVAIPSVVSHDTQEKTDKRGRVMWRTTLELEVTWSDGESSLTTRWVGVGEDAGDKSYYTAYTGALKYALLKTFCIGEGGADPEVSHPDETHQEASREDLESRLVQLIQEVVDKDTAAAFGEVATRAASKGKYSKLADLDERNIRGLINRLQSRQGKDRAAYIRDVLESQGNAG